MVSEKWRGFLYVPEHLKSQEEATGSMAAMKIMEE